MILVIFGYLLTSLYIGVNQYRLLQELSSTYITTQWIVLVVSALCTLGLQNASTMFGDFLATIGGGIAMMVIIQAVIFFLLGDIIASNLSNNKIILLIIFGIIIAIFLFKYLTKNARI